MCVMFRLFVREGFVKGFVSICSRTVFGSLIHSTAVHSYSGTGQGDTLKVPMSVVKARGPQERRKGRPASHHDLGP